MTASSVTSHANGGATLHEDLDELADMFAFEDSTTFRTPRGNLRPGEQARGPNAPPTTATFVAEAAHAIYNLYYVRPRPRRLDYTDPTAQELYLRELKGAPARAGVVDRVCVHEHAQGGFLHFASDPPPEGGRLARTYFSVTAEGGPILVTELLGALARTNLPFRVKTLRAPTGYNRADACVLYTRVADDARVLAALASGLDRAHLYLRGEPPRFTLVLARGIGYARDLGGAESFGQHVGRLAAEALWEARRDRGASRDPRNAIRAHFDAARVDPAAPWRGRI